MQNDKGKAKVYQIKQVLKAIELLSINHKLAYCFSCPFVGVVTRELSFLKQKSPRHDPVAQFGNGI